MLNKNAIVKFVQESVEYLVENQAGNCRYKLDDHLAIFVGWSSGYGDEKRDDVIQGKTNLDWGINAGIKVWTSDDMWCDYEWVNFPYYKDGDVWNTGWDVKPNEDYECVAKYLLDEYNAVKEFDMTDDGMILPREVEYDVVCFERTLKIKFSKGSNINKDRIWELLDKLYDEWQDDDDPDMCLEEYMVESICEICGLTVEDWDSIPYGENCGHRENLWLCEHCLEGLESREGNQATLKHYVDEMDAIDSRCEWCKECGFDTLYELI